MREKKKTSEKTKEIIPKKQSGPAPKRRKLSGFSIFFMASATVLATAGAVGTAKSIADVPKNIELDKSILIDNQNHDDAGEEDEMEKFRGMDQKELGKALLNAAGDGNGKEVELLIRTGADMEVKTSMGWTPLMMASRSIMSDDAALMLISSNAKVDEKNNVGMTALMIAAMCGRTTIVEALLNAGADPELKDNRGRTAYDFAVKYGMNKTVELITNHE